MTRTRFSVAAAGAALALALAANSPAWSHSGGGGGGGSSAGGSAGGGSAGGGSSGGGMGAGNGASSSSSGGALRGNTPVCSPGYVVKNGACTHVSLGVLPDNDLYVQGRALAVAGYYTRAQPVLDAVQRTDDAMVYTMRGFVARKMGHLDASMALYAKALAIDPENVNAHEYLGEAYVVMGKPDLAKRELVTVQRLCGDTRCEQYADLAEAIETGKPE
jgi:tetratricopeptide (TPR) repeat protein